MRTFRVDAMIERLLLLNYRADPAVVARMLPAPFRPQERHGYAVVGICLLRMGRARPAGLPGGVGFGSENAAHRVAVAWDAADGPRSGVFMPRLDSASRLNVAAGGRLVPGVQHRAEFDVAERPDRLRVSYSTSDGSTAVDVEVGMTRELVGSVLFDDAADASEFFRLGSAGYSAGRGPDEFEGLELATTQGRVDPCVVDRAASSFYDDRDLFPAGSIELDSALVMRQTPVRWTALVPDAGEGTLMGIRTGISRPPRPRLAGDDDVELRRLLDLARTHLGMEVALISECLGDEFVVRAVSGDLPGIDLVLEPGTRLGDTYCARVLAGVLPAVIPEARQHPGTRDLAVTQALGIGSYVGVPLHRPDGRPIGMLCCASHNAHRELDAQAARFLALVAELVSEHLLSPLVLARAVDENEADRVRAVLESTRLRMIFEPVVQLDDGAAVAFEALARFDDPVFATSADAFAAAARAGLGVELELLAVKQAFARLPELPDGTWLGVNLSAEALLVPAVQETLLAQAEGRIGVEITEHTAVQDYDRLIEITRRLRQADIQVAVDDAGAGYASFRHILKLRPSVIKLDLEIVRDIGTDPARQALTRALVGFSAEIGATLVAEGVETAAEAEMLRRLGVRYGQGYLFSDVGGLSH